MRTVTLPALIDVHVHLRYPGGEHKETVGTGTAAAVAGGVVAILCMPNTTPPITDGVTLEAAIEHIGPLARCDVGLYLGGTDANAAGVASAAASACGLKLYVNDTFGPLRIEGLGALAAHFSKWPRGRPLVVHAEGPLVAAAIGLAAATGRAVHVAHVSRRAEIEFIRAAKEAGLPVTCEVTPHHLWLTEDDARALGGFGEVRPRLATEDDRRALWENLDVIDCIATDHAPHTRDEKSGERPPPGMPGLETTLPLLLTAVDEGRLELERLVEMTSRAPSRIFGVPRADDSQVTATLGDPWTLPDRGYQTLADWSPFAGMRVTGRVRSTVLRGRTVWDGERPAEPGTGRMIRDHRTMNGRKRREERT